MLVVAKKPELVFSYVHQFPSSLGGFLRSCLIRRFVCLEETEHRCKIEYEVKGLTPGLHGFHIHEKVLFRVLEGVEMRSNIAGRRKIVCWKIAKTGTLSWEIFQGRKNHPRQIATLCRPDIAGALLRTIKGQ